MSLLTASGNQHMMAPNATGTKPRAKKQRTKSLERKKLPPTPDQQAASMAAQMEMMLSPPEYQTNGQNNPLALSHPNLEDLMSGEGHTLNGGMVSKPPPRYEEAAAMARSMQALQGGMPGQQCLESQYSNFSANLRQSQAAAPGTHPRQQSMPTTMSTTINNPTISNTGSNNSYSSHLSPPHSNMSSHMSPTQTLSPSQIGSAMSPPQSVQSNHTMSPPHHQQMHMSPPPHGNGGQQQLSPMKNQQMNTRPQQLGSQQLPTSPTHIAAM